MRAYACSTLRGCGGTHPVHPSTRSHLGAALQALLPHECQAALHARQVGLAGSRQLLQACITGVLRSLLRRSAHRDAIGGEGGPGRQDGAVHLAGTDGKAEGKQGSNPACSKRDGPAQCHTAAHVRLVAATPFKFKGQVQGVSLHLMPSVCCCYARPCQLVLHS